MRSKSRSVMRGVLVLVAVALPALMGVQLVRAVSVPANALDSLRLQTESLSPPGSAVNLPAPPAAAGDAGAAGAPASVSGVLYTRGQARIDWNGVSIPLHDGSYAYEGGETIFMQPGAMGLLRLSDGSSVFLCPGSSARVTMAEDGRVELELLRGASRFAFRAAQAFLVRANETLLEPSRQAAESVVDDFFVGEAKAYEKGGCLLCVLKNDISLALERAPQIREHVPVGMIADLRPENVSGDALNVDITPIPETAMSLIRTASAGDGAGARYLCRCEELHEFGRERGEQVAELPDSEPPVPDSLPEILPPDAPPIALAEPGPPDPFDPNLLPPPAAGEPLSPVVTVAPPASPGGRRGGGGIASPS